MKKGRIVRECTAVASTRIRRHRDGAHLPGRQGRSVLWAVTMLYMVLGLGVSHGSPARADTTTIPTCLGSHDLLIDASEVMVEGPASFGEIRVVRHGLLHLGTVDVGSLYVDGTGTVQ